jgi:S-DNA-T family DNA segregation ATPase FtsK/SpoIIIE
MIAAAEASGSHDTALKWAQLRHQHHEHRARRRADRSAALASVHPVIWAIAAVLAAVLATRAWQWFAATPWAWPAAAAPAAAAAAAAYAAGRRGASPSGWLATSADADMDVTIDESILAEALRALRIPQITDYFKAGLPLQFIVPCRADGRGTGAIIRLPAGVAAERIVRRRADVAASVHRLSKEVWLGTGDAEGLLTFWAADPGALAGGAGEYPLLESGTVDVFRGVPYGKTLRGDPVVAPVMERNTIVGGMPGQGKSAGARILMVGAALDVTADLRIWIPDTNFDFNALQPRCSRFVMGAETEHIEAITADLEELHQDVQTRGKLLIQHEVPAVTRQLASAATGLHPVFGLLEEAHVAITHDKYGKDIARLIIEIVRLGRKRGIHLILSTQAPTKDSMPRDVTRNCSNGIAYAVGDHVANDAILGSGAYRGGHRATDLIPGADRGTALVKGFSGERSMLVQAYYLDPSGDHDQVTPVIRRSLGQIERRGRGVPGAGARHAVQIRDLIDDLAAVLPGDGRVKARDAVGLLRSLAPSWAQYQKMTARDLVAAAARHGVRTVNSSGTPYLDPCDVRAALAARDAVPPRDAWQ